MKKGKEIIYNFKNISNDFEAYLLGFIYADGYISKESVFGIKIIKSDKYLLEKIRDYICPTSILYEEGNSIKFTVHNKELVDNLINLGVNHNKSYRENTIPNIDVNCLHSFVRGYFDGDGTVYVDKRNGSKTCISICSVSKIFIEQLNSIIRRNYILTTLVEEDRSHNNFSNMYRIYLRRSDSIVSFYNYVYENSTIHLTRKFDKINNHVNTVLNKENKESLSV